MKRFRVAFIALSSLVIGYLIGNKQASTSKAHVPPFGWPISYESIKTTHFAPKQIEFATTDGARWVQGTSAGPRATQDADGHWWVLGIDTKTINLSWFGAPGDYSDQTIAFKAAVAASQAIAKITPGAYVPPVFIPCGAYLISTSVPLGRVPIVGEATGCSIIYTSYLGSLFPIEIPKGGITGSTYKNLSFSFQGAKNSSTKEGRAEYALAFDLQGGENGFGFSGNTLENLRFNGFYADLRVGITSIVTTFGYEEPFSVNTFRGIETEYYGAVAPKYALWFLGGSGTGNVYDRFTGGLAGTIAGAAVLRYEGSCIAEFGCVPVNGGHSRLPPQTTGYNVVGDFKVENADVSTAAFVSVGAGSVYNDNQSFPGTQFDGSTPPIRYDSPPIGGFAPRGIRTCSTNMGGEGMHSGFTVQGSIICDRDSAQVLVGQITTSLSSLSPGLNQVRGIEIHLAENTATKVEVTMTGGGFVAASTLTSLSGSQRINNTGGLSVTAEYLVQRGRGFVTWSVLPNTCYFKNADGNSGLCGAAAVGPGLSTAQQLQINAYGKPIDDPNAMGFNPLLICNI